MREIVAAPRWDVALRLLGGVHYLVLAGRAPELAQAYAGDGDAWFRFRDVLGAEREWLAEFVETQPVQTNEVRRCWALLLGFLLVAREAGPRVNLIELGPSAGLNLNWDRYRYRYGRASWGHAAASIELDGTADGAPIEELLAVPIEIGRRFGIDRSPVDVTTEQGKLLLECFVWADQRERLARLRRAVAVARAHPPELVHGDYLELLPGFLAERDPDRLTVVYSSASTVYLEDEAFLRLSAEIAAAGNQGPLAWLSLEGRGGGPSTAFTGEEEWRGGHALELQLWPEGERLLLAKVHYHGAWLDWLAS